MVVVLVNISLFVFLMQKENEKCVLELLVDSTKKEEYSTQYSLLAFEGVCARKTLPCIEYY